MADDSLGIREVRPLDLQLHIKASVTNQRYRYPSRIIGGSDHKDILTLDHINEGLHGHTYSSA